MTCVIGTVDPATFFERSDEMKMRLLVLGLVFMGTHFLFASSACAVVNHVDVTSPGTIPFVPDNIIASGEYKCPAGTVNIDIYATDSMDNIVGMSLMSGSVGVAASPSTPAPWTITFASPATVANVDYWMLVRYEDNSVTPPTIVDFDMMKTKSQ